MGQENEVVALHRGAGDDLLVEGLAGLLILQTGLPQGGEQPVLRAVHHLLGGKGDVHQIFAQSPRQGLFQKAQVLFRRLLGGHAQGNIQVGDNLSVAVDKTAVDPADGAAGRTEAAAQLAQFFFVHGGSSMGKIRPGKDGRAG